MRAKTPLVSSLNSLHGADRIRTNIQLEYDLETKIATRLDHASNGKAFVLANRSGRTAQLAKTV